MQIDFFGQHEQPRQFRDSRATRPSVAEEKAVLLLRLGRLINHVPESIRSGSINATREWMDRRQAAAKVAASSRSSIQQITAAISSLARYQ